MIPLLAGQVALGVYTVLLAVGGILGYTKAGSKPSLIAGLASAAGAILALLASLWDALWGMGLGAVLAFLLCGFFGRRYARQTRKFMPSGLLSLVSLVVLVLLALVVLGR